MYTIYATIDSTKTLIYNDVTPELTMTKLIDPKLQLKDNTAGAFTAKIPQGNAVYDTVVPMRTTIDIYRDGSWIWRGRVLSIEKDFWLQKQITCEGALAFLNDTIAPLHKYNSYTIISFVRELLNIHNNKVGTNRQIQPGAISTTTSSGQLISAKDYITEGDNVLSFITKLAEDWGLHIRLRNVNDSILLDMLTDSQLNMATQRINFGSNLLDYSDNYDWSDLITVLHPLGAKLDTNNTTEDEQYPDRITITGTPSTSGFTRSGEYLINTSAVNTYGRIEETVEWSEVDDSATLLKLAELYLADYQYNSMELKVKLIDLHYLVDSDEVAFNFLDQINCYSRPHGLNTTFIATEMDIPFDKPDQTTFNFARSTMGTYGSDAKTGSFGGKISAASANVTSKAAILEDAKANAFAMIDMATNGYVTLVPADTTIGGTRYAKDRTAEIMITNNIDPEQATQRWRWNVNGLMHQHRNSVSDAWSAEGVDIALTMDGQIVATAITTGRLTVPDTNGGILFQADMDEHFVTIAGFTVTRTSIYNTKSSISSSNDGVYIGNDGIAIGPSNKFFVDVNNDTAKIAGFNFTTTAIYKDKTSPRDTTNGVYIGTDGIGVGASNVFYVDANSSTAVIAGFNFTSTAIYKDKTSPSNTTNGVYIGTNGIGVGESNVFYVNASNSTAVIAGFTFNNSRLYSGTKSSITSTNSGVYIGTDGIACGDGTLSMRFRDGVLEGARGGGTDGYVCFNTMSSSGGYGARLAGTSVVALLTNGYWGVGSYRSPSSDATVYSGETLNITVVTDAWMDGDDLRVTRTTYHFKKGILNDSS